MTYLRLIINNLRHYFKSNLWVALGVAITTAVLTGALIVGDSVIYSLEQSARLRLCNITHSVTSGDRFFTTNLSDNLNRENILASSALKLEAVASTEGGQMKLNKVNIWGIDNNFPKLADTDSSSQRGGREGALISSNLAIRLNLSVGDEIVLRIKEANLIPANAPFVTDEQQTVSYITTVAKIVTPEELGRISLQNSQTAPFNVFLQLDELNEIMELENRANIILISTSESEKKIEEIIRSSFTLKDVSLSIRGVNVTDQWELLSDRVFIDDVVTKSVDNTDLSYTPVFTYFANSLKVKENQTPYSFISTLPEDQLNSNEMIINQWLASDLKAAPGDSVSMSYYTIGSLRELTEEVKRFRIKSIVEIKGYFGDRSLMPQIPGLSDAENCRDWNTGVPVNLKTIRDKDEDYWYNYKGLPKAFISFPAAQQLWKNHYGSVTAFRFDRNEMSEEELTKIIHDQIDPFELGFQIRNVKNEGLKAAKNGTDFSSLFLGLSFFIIAASIILTSLLFVLSLEKRISEIGTLSALGYSNKTISKLFLREGVIIATTGAIIGLLFAFLYNELVFWGLNKVWNDIVRTDVLVSRYKLSTLLIGLTASIYISAFTIRLLLKSALIQNSSKLQRRIKEEIPKWKILLKRLLVFLLTGFAVGVIIVQLVKSDAIYPGLFFLAGGFLLVALILITDLYLLKKSEKKTTPFSFSVLVIENLRHNRARSLVIITLLSIATFLIVTTGLNRKDLFSKALDPKSGTGGFLFVAESTMPVLHNMNDPKFRKDQGITEDFKAVQFSIADGDDASCLNLNRITTPRIMGVDASMLKGRFTFQSFAKGIKKESDWEILQQEYQDCIPAVADQTVIQWGLGKKTGDTLTYKNSRGEVIKLLLVAGLKPSVFQGNVLIDKQYFLKNYPTSGGSNFFLIDGETSRKQEIADELEMQFRDLGFEITEAPKRLAEFLSIENTYLSIFIILGALGLLIGTVGLAVILQRTLIERKTEFSLMTSLGYTRILIRNVVVSEYLILLLSGVLIGLISAIISVWPILSTSISDLSPMFVLLLIFIVIVNGILWIFLLAGFQLKKMNLVEGLRNE